MGSWFLCEKNYLEGRNLPEYKNTDVIISIILKNENKAFKVEKYDNFYPQLLETDKRGIVLSDG